MVSYTPTSRRPIADAFRATAQWAVRFCVRRGIHPDAVSYASVVASGLAGICFWQGGAHPTLLLVGPAFCYLRLWLNMLDGMVALAADKATLRGEILNDLPDRVSDVLVFVGLAHSTLCSPFSGYWAAIAALLTAYVGTFGQAVGARRQFAGVMSKPWRMVVAHVGSWAHYGLAAAGVRTTVLFGLTVLDVALLLVVVGCIETISVRLRRILAALAAKATDQME